MYLYAITNTWTFFCVRLNLSVVITIPRGRNTLTIVLALREDDALVHIAAPSTTTPQKKFWLPSPPKPATRQRNEVPYI